VRVDHRPVKDAAVGALTGEIRRLYFDAARGRLRAYREWVVPVNPSERESEPEAVLAAGKTS
jgi:hypothetical protein